MGVPYAVVLLLDADTDRQIRWMWWMLDERGVPSVGTTNSGGYRPHVTLSVFDDAEAAAVEAALEATMAQVRGMPLTLSSLGFFPTPRAAAHLGVVPTRWLLGLHQHVDTVIGPLVFRRWSHYRPTAWVPHCTLATGVHDLSEVAQVVSQHRLPVHGFVHSVAVVSFTVPTRDGSRGKVRGPLALRSPAVRPARRRPAAQHRKERRGLGL